MDSTKLSEWTSIITNLAVVAGLVFLGFEFQQNKEMIAVERSAFTQDQINSVVEMVVQDPTLVELMGKDKEQLTQAEDDRLTLLGLRMLLNMKNQFEAAAAVGSNLEQQKNTQRAIFRRTRLNYGVPHAWETFRARGESEFTIWFEKEVLNGK
ncbi:MAG: hypothetical protein ACI9ON_003097 [Limisphaerales bacterium]|jgi:predicted aminopeptidase